jgi:hypothetical protein
MAVQPKENPGSCQRIDGFFWTYPAFSGTILAGRGSIVVMLPYERHERILAALREERFLKIEELLRLTRSSLTTLRRSTACARSSPARRRSGSAPPPSATSPTGTSSCC